MVRIPSDRPVREPADTAGQHTDVVEFGEVFITQERAFPEPDHTAEFAVQEMYEMTRDGGWADAYEGVEEQEAPGEYRHNPKCIVPHHQRWAVEKFGESYLGDDYWTGSGCVFGV